MLRLIWISRQDFKGDFDDAVRPHPSRDIIQASTSHEQKNLGVSLHIEVKLNNLLLVPTPTEAEYVSASLCFDSGDWTMQICGFGPIVSAARTSALIARYNPKRVFLIGIAGSFDPLGCPVGSAHVFNDVACYGIGVGSGPNYVSATALGWIPFGGDDNEAKIGDRIKIDCRDQSEEPEKGILLTCPTASADRQDVSLRLGEFPDAICEDMEGFSVAAACAVASVPLCIVRGISNTVADRDKANWDIAAAMQAACKLLHHVTGIPVKS